MTRRHWSSTTIAALTVVVFGTALAARASAPALPQEDPSKPSTPGRLAEMRHHFAQVMLVHEAVIRGDLPAVREPALKVAALAIPSGMPATVVPYVAAIRSAGQRAAEAKTLDAAATAIVAMVTECANCHQAVGVFPAPPRSETHDIGGIVGQMLEHGRAVDDMLLGLMIPSSSQWRQGAARLQVAVLDPAKLPPDGGQTEAARQARVRVHRLADQAVAAGTPEQRADVYREVLGSCAQCHGLHSKVWGPRRQR